MHDYGLIECVVCRHEGITVVDAATAIVVGVGQNNNVLIGDTGERVVECLEAQRCQIAFAVERIEMRRQGCLLPHPGVWNAHPTFRTGQSHSHDVEAVLVRRVRRIRKQFVRCHLCIPIEHVHFFRPIAFGHNGDVDALLAVAALVQIAVRIGRSGGQRADEDVVDFDQMRERRCRLLPRIVEFHRDLGILSRHR